MPSEPRTKPSDIPVEDFLASAPERRRPGARQLIALMRSISGEEPVMWGPSIIGFGRRRHRTAAGREGEQPALGFSPRAAALTIYFPDGFDEQSDLLARLGPHRTTVSCLYATRLDRLDLDVLRAMLERSHRPDPA